MSALHCQIWLLAGVVFFQFRILRFRIITIRAAFCGAALCAVFAATSAAQRRRAIRGSGARSAKRDFSWGMSWGNLVAQFFDVSPHMRSLWAFRGRHGRGYGGRAVGVNSNRTSRPRRAGGVSWLVAHAKPHRALPVRSGCGHVSSRGAWRVLQVSPKGF
jgi:hypothetical protein